MPLTHDIGVRIPYPLQNQEGVDYDAFCFFAHTQNFGSPHLPIIIALLMHEGPR